MENFTEEFFTDSSTHIFFYQRSLPYFHISPQPLHIFGDPHIFSFGSPIPRQDIKWKTLLEGILPFSAGVRHDKASLLEKGNFSLLLSLFSVDL